MTLSPKIASSGMCFPTKLRTLSVSQWAGWGTPKSSISRPWTGWLPAPLRRRRAFRTSDLSCPHITPTCGWATLHILGCLLSSLDWDQSFSSSTKMHPHPHPEELVPFCIAPGTVEWCSRCRRQSGSSVKCYTELPDDLRIPLLGVHPREMKTFCVESMSTQTLVHRCT